VAAHDVPPSIVMIDIGRSTLDVEAQLQSTSQPDRTI
jgi:hypothetical protein